MRTSYEVLGVPHGATPSEVRAAYLKRVKVLHPDRFDKETQSVEWQMANDMLKELNEAYNQLRSSDQNENEHSEPPKQPHNKHQQANYCDPTGLIDVDNTYKYWAEVSRLFQKPEQIRVPPVNITQTWSTTHYNPDLHLAYLEQYVRTSFECELAIASMNASYIDDMVIKAGVICRECLVTLSREKTKQIEYIKRVGRYYKHFPLRRALYLLTIGLFTGEYKALNSDFESARSGIAFSYDVCEKAKKDTINNLRLISVQLAAKYGNAYRA